MSLFRNIALRLAKLVGVAGEPTKVPDFANPPPTWLRFARPAIRRKSWFRAVAKSQLRRADVSKLEKRQLRKNLFQGHWATKLMRVTPGNTARASRLSPAT